MPIYEYKCNKCGEEFETRREFRGEAEEVKCPRCGSSDARRVFSPFSSCSSGGSCSPAPRFGFG